MTEGVVTRRSRLTPEREAELYAAVLELLREVGYDALTMDAVAAHTRASKATLYRQWGGKAQLVARALQHAKPTAPEGVDTGSLRGDLHATVCHKSDDVMEEGEALMRGMATAIHAHPDLAEAVRELLVAPERAVIAGVLAKAVERGEVSADNPAIPLVAHILFGAVIARGLIDDRAPTAEYMTGVVDSVILPALGL